LSKETVIEEIQAAFQGVRLGGGVGLFEAKAIDGHMDEATQRAYRAQDEKEDWTTISAEKLDRYHDSPCFFDAEGMRFHLPAFLIADLRGELKSATHPLFHLVRINGSDHLAEYRKSQLALLSRDQRAAIRSYLILLKDHPDHVHECPDIDAALQGYWKEKPSGAISI
jgi:hypothetical protein